MMASTRDEIEKYKKAAEAAKQFSQTQSKVRELTREKNDLSSKLEEVKNERSSLENKGLSTQPQLDKYNDLVQESKKLETQITSKEAELNALKQPIKEASQQHEATTESFKQDYKNREGRTFDAPSTTTQTEKPKHALDDKSKAQAKEAVEPMKDQEAEAGGSSESKPKSNSAHVEAAKKEAQQAKNSPNQEQDKNKQKEQEQER